MGAGRQLLGSAPLWTGGLKAFWFLSGPKIDLKANRLEMMLKGSYPFPFGAFFAPP